MGYVFIIFLRISLRAKFYVNMCNAFKFGKLLMMKLKVVAGIVQLSTLIYVEDIAVIYREGFLSNK